MNLIFFYKFPSERVAMAMSSQSEILNAGFISLSEFPLQATSINAALSSRRLLQP